MSEQTESLSTSGEDTQAIQPEEFNSARETEDSRLADSQIAQQEQTELAEDSGDLVDEANAEDMIPGPDDSTPGWHMDSSEPESPRSDAQSPATSGVFTRVSLGSALLAIDALNERLEQVEEVEEGSDPEPRTLTTVLVPQEDWEEQFGQAPGTAARHLTIGVMIDTRSKVSRSLSFLYDVGNATVRVLELVFDPITHSRLFRPVRKRYLLAVKRGDNQVNYWMNLGRAEDVRSRDVAETALTQVVDDSMDELVENERIQEFIQEMLAAQSIGMVDEAIEEIRERAVSSDTFFELPFRRIFRRAPRSSVPGPDFDRHLVRPPSKRNLPLDEGSSLAYYAGFTSRLLAFAIDAALVMVFMVMTGWFFQTIGNFLGDSPRMESLNLTSEMVSTIGVVLSSLNVVTIVVAYAFIFWILTGQTPGMMLLGLRVVTHDGGHLSFWRSLGRLLGFIVSAAFLFLGFAWILIDDRRQGWHDKIAGTYVVYSWDAHPDETFLTIRM